MALGVSDITYGDLLQYARDKLQDNPGEKTERQAARAVQRALRVVSESHDWEYLRRWFRIILREPITLAAEGSISAFQTALRGKADGWDAEFNTAFEIEGDAEVGLGDPAGWSFVFSGSAAASVEKALHRIRDYSVETPGSSLALYFYSNDVYHGSAALADVGGTLLKDRYPLPRNFKNLYAEPMEQDFIARLTRVSPDYMLYLKKAWSPTSNGPVFYCIQTNQSLKRKELVVWPAPTQRRSVDLLCTVAIEQPSDDADVIDWDPNKPEVLYTAIDRQCAIERGDREMFSMYAKDFRTAVWRAKGADNDDIGASVAGGLVTISSSVLKVQRSNHFTDVPTE